MEGRRLKAARTRVSVVGITLTLPPVTYGASSICRGLKGRRRTNPVHVISPHSIIWSNL